MRKQARRERNYRKLSDFQNMIRSVLIPNMEDKMSQLWNIYQDAIVEFENTDDAYHDKAAFYYDMWSDLGDGITDLWRGTKDVLRGAVDAVTDLGGRSAGACHVELSSRACGTVVWDAAGIRGGKSG